MSLQSWLQDGRLSASRRQLLLGSLGGAAGFGLPLRAFAAAAGSTPIPTDYKALVCVMLNGGNDSPNTVIPYSQAAYDEYVVGREGALTRPYGVTRLRADLLPISAGSVSDGRQLALPIEMSALKSIYDAGRAAIIANVGVLSYPTTRAQYDAGTVEIPPQLFSHSDQLNFWQVGVPSYTTPSGWGGRMADLLAAANANAQVSIMMSLAGTNVWQVGSNVVPYVVSPSGGATAIEDINDPVYGAALRAMLGQSRSNRLERELVRVYNRSIDAESALSAALAQAPNLDAFFPAEPPPSVPNGMRWAHAELIAQLKMVAKMIAMRGVLNQKRQVFYVALGGFDNHSTLADHRFLLQAVSDGLAALYAATAHLNVASQVTSFTGSDFGRPFMTNGGGSDHGWGGHHFVVGGAVNGGNVYGAFPRNLRDSPDTIGNQGHLIPKLSVDQYAATLARWFGVADADLALVLPNLARFSPRLLGFLPPG
jgi:uncharacterized protein (DUF1501 family)